MSSEEVRRAELGRERLEELMAEQDLSQRALAAKIKELGLSLSDQRRTIDGILKGKRYFTVRNADIIAPALGVIPAYLLGVSDDCRIKKSQTPSESGQEQSFGLPGNLPPVRNWVGRSQEIEELKDQILGSQTRAIAIIGSTIGVIGSAGIGKTILASKLVRLLKEQNAPFHMVIWESLRPDPGSHKPPRFDLIIDSLLLKLSSGQITTKVTFQDDYRKKTERLVHLLRSKACLVVLDNVETTLQIGDVERAGYFAADCPEYAWLFTMLAGTEHLSKVVFTSRELLEELPKSSYYSKELEGLDRGASIELLKPFHLIATNVELEELVDRYKGHPKALELVAALIRDDYEFQKNVGKFLQDHHWLLIQSIENMIDQVIQRLSEEEKICLSRVSVYQTQEYPLTLKGFVAQMPEVDVYILRDHVIEALRARQLLDYDQERLSYQFHPLLQEKAYRILHPNFTVLNPECQEAHRRAYRYFLSIPIKPESEWKETKDVKTLLQAYYHACQAEDWDEAIEIIEPLGFRSGYLYQWGEFRLLIEVLKKLLPTDWRRGTQEFQTPEVQGKVLNSISFAYNQMGKYQIAVEYGQQASAIAGKIGSKEIEARALRILGVAFRNLGKYKISEEHLQKALVISREISDRQLEGGILSNLIVIYRHWGQLQTAVRSGQQALAITREIGERGTEGRTLSNLGLVYQDLKEYRIAIDYVLQALSIAREIGDRHGEGRRLNNLGLSYHYLKEYSKAIEYYEQGQAVTREVGDKLGEGTSLGHWGKAHRELGQYSEALKKLQAALAIFREIGHQKGEAEVLRELAETYWKMNDFDQARDSIEQAVVLATELGISLVQEYQELKSRIDG